MSLLLDILTHPANRQSRLSSLSSAVYWQCYKRLTGKPLDIDYHGYRLRCYPNNRSSSRAIYFSGYPDFWEMKFIQDYLKSGDNFIDGGSNVGLYTLLAASLVGQEGHIDAFEPNSDVASLLRKTIELNDLRNIDVHELGLAESVKQASFIATSDDCTSHIGAVDSKEVHQGQTISVTRLDSYLQDQSYAMAKFDIEGYEPFAVRGTKKWLVNNNPTVMLLEVAGYSNRYGISSSDFIEELESYGYFTAVYCPESKSLIKTRTHWEIPTQNVLAVARESEDLVLKRLLTD